MEKIYVGKEYLKRGAASWGKEQEFFNKLLKHVSYLNDPALFNFCIYIMPKLFYRTV